MPETARKSPQKECVNPECSEKMHSRTKVCPKCQTEQPLKSSTKKAKTTDYVGAIELRIAELDAQITSVDDMVAERDKLQDVLKTLKGE